MFHDITVSVAPGLRRDHAQIDLEALPAKVVMFTVKLAMQATSPCSGEIGGITARAGDTGFRNPQDKHHSCRSLCGSPLVHPDIRRSWFFELVGGLSFAEQSLKSLVNAYPHAGPASLKR